MSAAAASTRTLREPPTRALCNRLLAVGMMVAAGSASAGESPAPVSKRDPQLLIAGIKSPEARARAEAAERKSAEAPLLLAAPVHMRALSGPAPRTVQLTLGMRPLAPPLQSVRWELSADSGKSWTTLVAEAPPAQRLEHRFDRPGTYLIRPVGASQDGQVVEGQPISIGITGTGP